jgi:hypothetical protein
VKNGKAGVDNAKVKFDEVIAVALDEALDSINVPGVLFYSGVVSQEKEFRVGDSSEGSCIIELVLV